MRPLIAFSINRTRSSRSPLHAISGITRKPRARCAIEISIKIDLARVSLSLSSEQQVLLFMNNERYRSLIAPGDRFERITGTFVLYGFLTKSFSIILFSLKTQQHARARYKNVVSHTKCLNVLKGCVMFASLFISRDSFNNVTRKKPPEKSFKNKLGSHSRV